MLVRQTVSIESGIKCYQKKMECHPRDSVTALIAGNYFMLDTLTHHDSRCLAICGVWIMTSFAITLYGQCCRLHVVGKQVISDIIAIRSC